MSIKGDRILLSHPRSVKQAKAELYGVFAPQKTLALDQNQWYDICPYHWWDMAKSKVAISLDESVLDRIDKLVAKAAFTSRSQAIQDAVEEKLARLNRSRLARECAKLDPEFEKALAEEGLSKDALEWPE